MFRHVGSDHSLVRSDTVQLQLRRERVQQTRLFGSYSESSRREQEDKILVYVL
jgi:hypothetical protein